MMKVLVTGAGGFIGSCAVASWAERNDLTLFPVVRSTAPEDRSVRADLSERGWSRRLPEHADVVVHLAQSTRYNDFPAGAEDMVRVTIDATVELLEWARQSGVQRFIFASTGNVYAPSSAPLTEEARCEPQSFYGATKLAAERLMLPFAEWFQIRILRLFSVYGPGQARGLVPTILERLRTGQEITLAGGMGTVVSPLLVDDCVRLLDKFLTTDGSDADVINIGGPDPMSVRDIALACAKAGGWRPNFRETEGPPLYLVPDISKARSTLKDIRYTSPSEGLALTVRRSSDWRPQRVEAQP